MLNQLNFEQVRRVEHRGLMMTLETKDVWNETDWIILLPETQPHVVIFSAKPANLAELIIVAAELEQGIAAKHRHRIDIGILHQNLRIPIVAGEQADAICWRVAETAKPAVGGGVLIARDGVEKFAQRVWKN
jgi:hypothetical protein